MTAQAAELSFHNISAYYLPRQNYFPSNRNKITDGEPKYILKNVNGFARSDQLLAIMGASGVGKSTLLNILTGRKMAGSVVSGDIRLNGQTIPQCELTSLSAFVEQKCLLQPCLTIREHLQFLAILTMNKKIAAKEKLQRVEDVITELGLSTGSDTTIGNLSGGERKRLALASELLANSSLLICDEPTTGLDSFMAQNVVSVLKSMTEKGKIVIATIHQPTSAVFKMFDRIMLVAEGRVAFLGNRLEALEFFRTAGFECPKTHNPSDYYIRTLAIIPGTETENRQTVQNLCDQFEKFQEQNKNQEQKQSERLKIQPRICTSLVEEKLRTTASKRQYQAATWTQIRMLMWCCTLVMSRESRLIKGQCVTMIIVTLIVGILFVGQILNQESVMNINGCLVYLLIEQSFQSVHFAVNSVVCELPKVYSQHDKKMYQISSYMIARTIVEIPFIVISSVVRLTGIYWVVGLQSQFMKYFYACWISILMSGVASSFGYVISTSSSTIVVAIALTGSIMDLIMQFSGFFLNVMSFPNWLSWLQYFSWLRFSFEATVINQWEGIHHIDCDRFQNQTCIRNGDEVIEHYNFDKNNFYPNMMFMVVQYFAYRLLAYFIIIGNVKIRRS